MNSVYSLLEWSNKVSWQTIEQVEQDLIIYFIQKQRITI